MRWAPRRLQSTCSRWLLDLLLKNSELNAADARSELRWMREEARRQPKPDDALADMVRRRANGQPLQYIFGNTDFGELTLRTRAPVLIPRPETAHIVEVLAQRLPSRPLRVLDLCTGSGCIPLLLAHLRPNVTAYGVDIGNEAVALAKENARELGMQDRVQIFQADILAPRFVQMVRQRMPSVDIITSNPPYIPETEYRALPASVREFEDPQALLGDDVAGIGAGVSFYARIAELAQELLVRDAELDGVPRVAVEIGATQAAAVSRLLPGKTEVVKDQFGRDRMVLASVF